MRDDDEIIALLYQRDEQVLDLLHKQYGALCFQIAYRITGNREDAEECVNDMLMSVWNSIPPNRPDHLPAYCAALVRNSALQKYEKSHRQKRFGTVRPLCLRGFLRAYRMCRCCGPAFISLFFHSHLCDSTKAAAEKRHFAQP